MSTRHLLVAGAILALACGQARAQAAPDNNIDDRLRQQVQVPTPAEREEAILTGDTDIVLMRKTKLFSLSGSVDLTRTSNAFLAPQNRVHDVFGQGQATAGIGTRIAGMFDVFASAGLVSVRYFQNEELDYNAITGLVGAQANYEQLAVTATYQPTLVLSRDFGNRQLTSHRLRLAVAYRIHAGRLTIEPSASVERVLANPSDYEAWSGSGGVTISAPVSNKLPLLAYVSGRHERRDFDSYFSDLVGVKRVDSNWTAGAGIIWRPRQWAEARASYQFQRNRSTSDVNGYIAHSGTLGVSASMRF